MGFNFTGIAIDKNFDNDPNKVVQHLGLPLKFVENVIFETGSSNFKESKYLDLFITDKGTIIYSAEPFDLKSSQSKGCQVLEFTVSETAMAFHFGLSRNGEKIREIMVHEDNIMQSYGDKLQIENTESDPFELIQKQIEILTGINFNSVDLSTQGFRYERVQLAEEEVDPGPLFDTNSQASNPGRLKLNALQWIKCNSLKVIRITLYMIASLYATLAFHWIFIFLFIATLLYNLYYWYTAKGKFAMGDVNPGKVISLNPDRVAVATNMTKMFGDYPILRIIETKLTKREKSLGYIIPTVAVYHDNPFDYPFWAEFNPSPISHGVSDIEQVEAFKNTWSQDDILELEKRIGQINTTHPGTYKINIEGSGWKDYPEVIIGSISKMKGPDDK